MSQITSRIYGTIALATALATSPSIGDAISLEGELSPLIQTEAEEQYLTLEQHIDALIKDIKQFGKQEPINYTIVQGTKGTGNRYTAKGHSTELDSDIEFEILECKQPPVRDMVAFNWRSCLTSFDFFSHRTSASLCN